jgi:hypothetical protein
MMTLGNVQLRFIHYLLISKLRKFLRRPLLINPIRDDLSNFQPQMPDIATGNHLHHGEMGTTARQSSVTISK